MHLTRTSSTILQMIFKNLAPKLELNLEKVFSPESLASTRIAFIAVKELEKFLTTFPINRTLLALAVNLVLRTTLGKERAELDLIQDRDLTQTYRNYKVQEAYQRTLIME